MKVYILRSEGMLVGEVEDGATCMEIGALDHSGGPPIEYIDRDALEFKRTGEPKRPFPARHYRTADVKWSPADA